jgi:protoporphyrinogen oxidase
MYFPDEDAPFYRVGFPHAISPSVVPPGASSLYVEFGLTRSEHPDPAVLESRAVAWLRHEGILETSDEVVVRDWIRIDPGYVIFDRARQEVLDEVVPRLKAVDVHPIGRYGAWTYSYMERAILDGLETAEMLTSLERHGS